MITSWVIIFNYFGCSHSCWQEHFSTNKGQLFVESIVGGLRDIVEPIVGRKLFFHPFGYLVDYLFLS